MYSPTGRAGEVVKVLDDRKVGVACAQEMRWIGSGHFWCWPAECIRCFDVDVRRKLKV